MRRKEQSGQNAGHQNAFGPQSGSEVSVPEVPPPVPSPTSGCGGEVPVSGGAVPVSGEGDALPSAQGEGSAGSFSK